MSNAHSNDSRLRRRPADCPPAIKASGTAVNINEEGAIHGVRADRTWTRQSGNVLLERAPAVISVLLIAAGFTLCIMDLAGEV